MDSPEGFTPPPQNNEPLNQAEHYSRLPSGVFTLLRDMKEMDITIDDRFIQNTRAIGEELGLGQQFLRDSSNPGPIIQTWVINTFLDHRLDKGFRFFSPDIDTPAYQHVINARPDGTVTLLDPNEKKIKTLAEFDMITIAPGEQPDEIDQLTLYEIKGAGSSSKDKGKNSQIGRSLEREILTPKVKLLLDRINRPVSVSCVLVTPPNSYGRNATYIQSFKQRGGYIAELPKNFQDIYSKLK